MQDSAASTVPGDTILDQPQTSVKVVAVLLVAVVTFYTFYIGRLSAR